MTTPNIADPLSTERDCHDFCLGLLDSFKASSRMGTDSRLALAVSAAGSLRIRFNGRFTARVADANSATQEIRLSKQIWPRLSREQRENTLSHELAHLVAEGSRPGSHHDCYWSAIHRALGGDGRRLADRAALNLEGIGAARPFTYVCGCRSYAVTARKHNNIQKALKRGRSYSCRTCGVPVRLES